MRVSDDFLNFFCSIYTFWREAARQGKSRSEREREIKSQNEYGREVKD